MYYEGCKVSVEIPNKQVANKQPKKHPQVSALNEQISLTEENLEEEEGEEEAGTNTAEDEIINT